MNKQTLELKWTQLKGEFRHFLSELSFDDLDKTQRNFKTLLDNVERQFCEVRQEVADKLHDVANRVAPQEVTKRAISNVNATASQSDEAALANFKSVAPHKRAGAKKIANFDQKPSSTSDY